MQGRREGGREGGDIRDPPPKKKGREGGREGGRALVPAVIRTSDRSERLLAGRVPDL